MPQRLGTRFFLQGKPLAWPLYCQQQILSLDRVRPKVNEEILKGFASFSLAEKEKEERERAEHPPKPSKNQQFQRCVANEGFRLRRGAPKCGSSPAFRDESYGPPHAASWFRRNCD